MFTLTKDHVKALRATAFALTHNAADADDLTQDAILRAFEKGHQYNKTKGPLRSWLRTILMNVFINKQRARCRHERLLERFAVMEIQRTHAVGVEDAYTKARAISAVRDASKSIHETQRAYIGMFDAGASYKEIASAVNVPMGTVMSRIHRGRAKIKEALASNPDVASLAW